MDDKPANHVYVDTFYIDKYEVTNTDYAKFVQATGAKAPWHWPQGKIPMGEEKYPVANVNWNEATDYCKWLGKRLPTEAEWEKAARGGLDRAHYSWGATASTRTLKRVFCHRRSPYATPTLRYRQPSAVLERIVGSFDPNGFGLFDITGNVMEWTNDWYDNNYLSIHAEE